MSRYNAMISYITGDGRRTGIGLWVMEYEQEQKLGGSSAQSKRFKHFYPRSYSPGGMKVTGRMRSQTDYDRLADFIRNHQQTLISLPGGSDLANGKSPLPLLRFSIPDENIYIDGYIETFEAGVKRFNPAPEFTFIIVAVKDAHSPRTELVASHALRAWWTGQMIDGQEDTKGKVGEKSEDLGDGPLTIGGAIDAASGPSLPTLPRPWDPEGIPDA